MDTGNQRGIEEVSRTLRSGAILKIAFVAYAVFLTALLLIDDPTRMIGVRTTTPHFLHALMPLAHLLSFSALTVLALAARWPLPPWCLVTLLIVYGATTEIVQGFLPPRTPEWNDWFQDIAGVLLGVGFYWGLKLLSRRVRYAIGDSPSDRRNNRIK